MTNLLISQNVRLPDHKWNRGYRDNADVPVNSRKGLLLNRQKQQQTINHLDVLTADENKIKFLPDADNLCKYSVSIVCLLQTLVIIVIIIIISII